MKLTSATVRLKSSEHCWVMVIGDSKDLEFYHKPSLFSPLVWSASFNIPISISPLFFPYQLIFLLSPIPLCLISSIFFELLVYFTSVLNLTLTSSPYFPTSSTSLHLYCPSIYCNSFTFLTYFFFSNSVDQSE